MADTGLALWAFANIPQAITKKVQWWFLHIEAVGGLCMPSNECSKGGELLATGQLSNRALLVYVGRPFFL